MLIKGRTYILPVDRELVSTGETGTFYTINQNDRKRMSLSRYGAVELIQNSQLGRFGESKAQDEFEFPYEIPAEDTVLAYTLFQAANMLASRLINRLSIKYEQSTADYNIELQRHNNTEIAQLYIVITNKFGNRVCEATYFIVHASSKSSVSGDRNTLDVR